MEVDVQVSPPLWRHGLVWLPLRMDGLAPPAWNGSEAEEPLAHLSPTLTALSSLATPSLLTFMSAAVIMLMTLQQLQHQVTGDFWGKPFMVSLAHLQMLLEGASITCSC